MRRSAGRAMHIHHVELMRPGVGRKAGDEHAVSAGSSPAADSCFAVFLGSWPSHQEQVGGSHKKRVRAAVCHSMREHHLLFRSSSVSSTACQVKQGLSNDRGRKGSPNRRSPVEGLPCGGRGSCSDQASPAARRSVSWSTGHAAGASVAGSSNEIPYSASRAAT